MATGNLTVLRRYPRILHPVSLGKPLSCCCSGLRMDLLFVGRMCGLTGNGKCGYWAHRSRKEECASSVSVSVASKLVI